MYILNLKHKIFRSLYSWNFLIRVIFCASCLTGLNLVEEELPEQNLSVIPEYQEFGILEETAENIDDLKMVTVRFYHGYTLKNL